jgi:Tfp pilus assembly protein PilF
LHVPLIVCEVGKDTKEAKEAKEPKGIVIDTPVRHVDLVPTILAAAGEPVAGSGASLIETINAGRGVERPSYFEAMSAAVTRGWAPLRGVLVGREKYIDLPIVELYDLAADPQEATNVAASRADRTRVMVETLKQFDVAPPAHARTETADTIERLRSLGYIGGGSATVKEKYTDADDPKRLVAIEQMLTRGNDALRAGHAEEAAAIYRAIIQKRPDTEDAYRKLALIDWRAGRPGDAIATLELALRNGVTQSEVRIRLGQYLAESGQAAKAIELLKDTAGTDPDALNTLGNAYTTAGRLTEATAIFRRLIAQDPSNALAYENLGMTQLQGHDVKGAEASLRHAIQLDPSLGGAYTALGVVLATSGRTNEAIGAWKKALALDPSDENAADNLKRVSR